MWRGKCYEGKETIMLRSVYDMRGYTIRARDGALGQVDQFLIDDRTGRIRYLVVRIGGWLLGRRVLITPEALGPVNTSLHTLDVVLTQQQIEDSPEIETNLPVPQQHAAANLQGNTMLGWEMLPGPWYRSMSYSTAPSTLNDVQDPRKGDSLRGDPRLRSTRELIGYRLQASDGASGHVVDFIIDDTIWTIRFVVVDTGIWWPGKRVVLPWQRIEAIHWVDSTVEVGVLRATVKRHPEYVPARLRQQERIQNGSLRPEPPC
jgi:sporulation protein YlmC with PRC-barrel domain